LSSPLPVSVTSALHCLPISLLRKNCNSDARLLNQRKKAPVGVLFCGIHQTFVPPGIAENGLVWYLTITFILKREINRSQISAS
ncbi:hypothetical protein, partial [Enterococcus spodopteracolus]|uniref:hypothetical protein n=1 Tax=Enterococcus spodopteracolus TaxID=3034501 RepID=UPI002649D56E